jgi:hypothetical protein
MELMTDPAELGKLRDQLAAAMKAHSPRTDSFFHNGGTALALATTTAATIIPSDAWLWPKIAAGAATFIVALARALDFGSRWRFHIDMRANYAALLDRVDEVSVLPASEQLAATKRIYDNLEKLRLREGAMPGAGTTSATS